MLALDGDWGRLADVLDVYVLSPNCPGSFDGAEFSEPSWSQACRLSSF